MSRVATLTLMYLSDFTRCRKDLAEFRAEVENNPIKVPFSGGGMGRGGPATTFGGGMTSTGQGSISAVAHTPPPVQTVVNNYYGGGAALALAAGASPGGRPSSAGVAAQMLNSWAQAGFRSPGVPLPSQHSMRMGNVSAPGISELFGIDFDGSPSGGGRMSYNGNRGWTGGPRGGGFGGDIIDAEWSSVGPKLLGMSSPFDTGSYGTYSGGPVGPWMANNKFFSGGSSGGWGNFLGGDRRSLQKLLANQGFRGAARLFGTYSLVDAGFNFANQKNQFGVDLGGATSTADMINAQQAYSENNPAYKLPIVGDWFKTINESLYGERAALASTQSGTRLSNDTYSTRFGTYQSKLAGQATVAGLAGDYAGQFAAADLRMKAAIQDRMSFNGTKIGDLSIAQSAFQESQVQAGNYFRDKNGKLWARSTLGGRAAQQQDTGFETDMAALKFDTTSNTQNQKDINSATHAEIGRRQYSDIVGSNYELTALNREFGNTRGANLSRLVGGYETRIAGTMDVGEIWRQRGLETAALQNENRQYARETGFMQFDVGTQQQRDRGSVYASGHYNYSAQMEGINADARQAYGAFRRETAGLDASDPMQAERIKAANDKYISAIGATTAAAAGLTADFTNAGTSMKVYAATSLMLTGSGGFGTGALDAENRSTYRKFYDMWSKDKEHDYGPAAEAEYAQNRQGYLDHRFGAVMSNNRRDSNTIGNDYRSRGEPLAGSVSEAIRSGQNDILQAEYDLRGDTQLRDATVKSIRMNTLSAINAQITPAMKYGGRLEQVSAFVVGGDRNNRGFAEFKDALGLQQGAEAALDNSEKAGKLSPTGGNNPTAAQITDLQNKMADLILKVGALQ